jgi:formylglycine-generating enzyme required for sulfatase activity
MGDEASMEGPYTRYSRATMWLLRGGELTFDTPFSVERHRKEVQIKPFYISKSPITNEQFEVFRPDYTRGAVSEDDQMPAVNISYANASAYCRWYSERTSKAFRLPTELEWEYACRAESETRYFFGDDPESGDSYLWDARTSEDKLHPIEQKKANGFGLFEMLGTVWEWTDPPYMAASNDAHKNDGLQDNQRENILRGASFRIDRAEFDSYTRLSAPPSTRRDDIGFRIVRSL